MTIHGIIGFIANYSGGFDPEKGIIQVFNTKEKKGESALWALEKACNKYLDKSALTHDLELVELTEGFFALYSREICQAVLQEFSAPNAFLGRTYLNMDESLFTEIRSAKYFDYKDQGTKERLVFLHASVLRHQNGKFLYFYNDLRKALLVYRLLCWLGEEDDEVVMSSSFLTPHATRIEVKGDLLERIKKRVGKKI